MGLCALSWKMPHVILVHYAAVHLWTRLHWYTMSGGDRQRQEKLVSTGSTSSSSLVWYKRQKHRTCGFFSMSISGRALAIVCVQIITLHCNWTSWSSRLVFQLSSISTVLYQMYVWVSVILSFKYILFLFICIGKHPFDISLISLFSFFWLFP